jgi:integrase
MAETIGIVEVAAFAAERSHPSGAGCLAGRGRAALGWAGSASETTMPTENSLPPARRREPWNKGRLIGQKRPLKPKDVWTIRVRLQLEGRKRDLAMFNPAIDSKLRGCDLVRLKIDDVCTGRDRATVVQKKTGRPVKFEITEQTRAAVGAWLASVGPGTERYLFPSRLQDQPHLSGSMPASFIAEWLVLASTVRPIAPTRCAGQS